MASVPQLLCQILAVLLVAVGMAGAVLPLLPGIPLIFFGLWLFAGVDHYRHLGWGWLLCIAAIGLFGLALDFASAALGAKRVGASPRAIFGALIGTLVGVFFGLPGLLLGPFFGALLGEISAGRTFGQSANAGIATWIGLLFGTVAKLAASIMMVMVFAAVWWWHRQP